MQFVVVFCYMIQLITIKLFTQFQNPKSSSSCEIFDRKIFTGEGKNEQIKGLISNLWLFVTHYNSSQSSFVPNFGILSQVVAEKCLTEKMSICIYIGVTEGKIEI